jgi:hypothetical protein
LEPGSQTLPPVEGSEAIDAPTPPGTPMPDDPPEKAGPSGALGSGPSEETNGFIALLRSDEQLVAPVRVLFTGDGNTTTIVMNDSGTVPDVTAGDGIWAGVAESAPLSGAVSVEVAGDTREGGVVSWGPDEKPRELKLTVQQEALNVEATTHTAAGAPAAAEGDPSVAGDVVGPAVVSPEAPAAGPMAAPQMNGVAVPVHSADGAGGFDWMGALALVLALAALGLVLMRRSPAVSSKPEAVPEPSSLPTRMNEMGILGSGTPSLSDGVSVWTGPEAILGTLLATVARTRSVVVAAPEDRTVPPVAAGPVFRVNSLQPHVIEAAVRSVQAAGGLSVCVVALPDGDVDDPLVASIERGLPDGVGALIFGTSASCTKPFVGLEPAAGGVAISVGGRKLRPLRVTPRGFDLD